MVYAKMELRDGETQKLVQVLNLDSHKFSGNKGAVLLAFS